MISTRPDGTVAAAGELDAHRAAEFDAALAAMPADADGMLDVSGVTFMDSSVLRVLIRHHDRLSARVRQLRLVDPSEPVRRLLEVSRLAEMFGTSTFRPS